MEPAQRSQNNVREKKRGKSSDKKGRRVRKRRPYLRGCQPGPKVSRGARAGRGSLAQSDDALGAENAVTKAKALPPGLLLV